MALGGDRVTPMTTYQHQLRESQMSWEAKCRKDAEAEIEKTPFLDRIGLMRAMCHVEKCRCADRGGIADDYDACRLVSRHANAIISVRDAEIERLKASRQEWQEASIGQASQITELRAEIERLMAEK
jgi:hypothetical protein